MTNVDVIYAWCNRLAWHCHVPTEFSALMYAPHESGVRRVLPETWCAPAAFVIPALAGSALPLTRSAMQIHQHLSIEAELMTNPTEADQGSAREWLIRRYGRRWPIALEDAASLYADARSAGRGEEKALRDQALADAVVEGLRLGADEHDARAERATDAMAAAMWSGAAKALRALADELETKP